MRSVACVLSLALATLLGFVQDVRADVPCEGTLVSSTALGDDSGIGGTGLSGESGMGGTGHSGESGIGGTGLSGESGVGGTGLHVYGTLNAFGSLCVNGLRVVLDSDVTVQRAEREAAGVESLAVGQVLFIEAVRRDDTLHARHIQVVEALSGRLEAVDREKHTLRLAGYAVDVPDSATYGDGLRLTVGESVRVFGLWQDDSRVVATRIVAAPDATPRVGARLSDLLRAASPVAGLSLEGYVAARPEPERLQIEGLELDVARLPARDRPLQGERVRAIGILSPNRVLRVAPPRPPKRPEPIERPPEKEPATRPDRPPVVDRPPTIEKPPVIEKPPTIDRIRAPTRIDVRP